MNYCFPETHCPQLLTSPRNSRLTEKSHYCVLDRRVETLFLRMKKRAGSKKDLLCNILSVYSLCSFISRMSYCRIWGEKRYPEQNMGISDRIQRSHKASGLVRAEVTSFRSSLVQLFPTIAWCWRAQRHNSSCVTSTKLLISFMPQFTVIENGNKDGTHFRNMKRLSELIHLKCLQGCLRKEQ